MILYCDVEMNENLFAVGTLVVAFLLAYFGLDDASLAKMVVTAYVGYLLGKRMPTKTE